MSIGVMKDSKLKLRDLYDSYTLGCVGDEINRREVVECDG